jgi:ferredoxin
MSTVTVTFIEANGNRVEVKAPPGITLLEVAHRNGIEIEGICGGAMACATCHLVVAEEWFDAIPGMFEDEEGALKLARGVTPTSRLGCQITLTQELDGLVVQLAES